MARLKKEQIGELGLNDIHKVIIGLRKDIRMLTQGLLAEKKMAYTNQEIMEMFGIGTKTLKKWRDSGILGYSQVGNIYLYSKKDITEFLQFNHYDVFADDRAFRDIVSGYEEK